MARDDEKKTTGRGRKKAEDAEPKAGTRAKSGSARTAKATGSARTSKATSARTAPAQESGSTATTKARARKPDAAKRGRNTSMPTEPTERDFREATHEEIARRAYQVWQETGNEDALENWMRAERELREGNRER